MEIAYHLIGVYCNSNPEVTRSAVSRTARRFCRDRYSWAGAFRAIAQAEKHQYSMLNTGRFSHYERQESIKQIRVGFREERRTLAEFKS